MSISKIQKPGKRRDCNYRQLSSRAALKKRTNNLLLEGATPKDNTA
jgi:hypothetical protein